MQSKSSETPRGEVFFVSLRKIAENFSHPERLNRHPWVHSLTVQDAVAHDPALSEKSPGTQLISTIVKLFRQLMPSTPPQQDGKRLDTRWGRFGILAANYFAPLCLAGCILARCAKPGGGSTRQSYYLFTEHRPISSTQIRSKSSSWWATKWTCPPTAQSATGIAAACRISPTCLSTARRASVSLWTTLCFAC